MVLLHDLGPDYEATLSAMHGPLISIDCGKMGYNQALELQLYLSRLVGASSIPSVCLLLEHHPVITMGIRKDHNQLVSNEQALSESGVDLVPVRRGGGVTAHNPGQLVIYPIVLLNSLGFRVAPFVHYLEQVGMDVLQCWGVAAERRKRYPGLWAGEKKIASVGVQIIRGVTIHGIAINLKNDLSIFSHMVPCGITDVQMTSAAAETGLEPDMEQAKHQAAASCLANLPDIQRTAGGTA